MKKYFYSDSISFCAVLVIALLCFSLSDPQCDLICPLFWCPGSMERVIKVMCNIGIFLLPLAVFILHYFIWKNLFSQLYVIKGLHMCLVINAYYSKSYWLSSHCHLTERWLFPFHMHILLLILELNSGRWSLKGSMLRHGEVSTIIADRHVVFLVLQRCMQTLSHGPLRWRTSTSSSLERYAEKRPVYWSHWYYSSSQCLDLISGEAYRQLAGIVTDRQWNMSLLSGQETVSEKRPRFTILYLFCFLQIIRLLMILKQNILFDRCLHRSSSLVQLK